MGRNSNDIAAIDWNGFTGKSAVFPVCMRSPSVRGRSLDAQMIAAAEKIDHLVILLCDSLDRHNMREASQPKLEAMKLANSWIEGNLERIKPYFRSVEVLGWEKDITTHPLFKVRVDQIADIREKSEAYRNVVHCMSSYYLESKRRRFETDQKRGLATWFDSEEAYESSRIYLEEEFAGNMVCHHITGGLPYIYHGLWIDDDHLFVRESGASELAYPVTLPVTTKRHGSSMRASSLYLDPVQATAA